MLSVIIPSYKDPLLHETIDSLLENAEGEIEIIPVLDGYWPEKPIKSDERIRVLHLGKNRGMQGAINAGARIAQGESIRLARTRRYQDNEESVSVIIPSREERFLNRTIREIQEKLRGNYEIIVILDGTDSERVEGVKYIYNKEAKGMRTAINQAVAEARGKYIMKLDAHCMLDEGMDEKLKAVHQDDWIQAPRRKRFNAHEWKLVDTDQPDIDYMFIHKFKGYKDNEKNRDPELKKELIDDTEIFQGSCYFITKDYFNRLNLLDDKNFGKIGSEALEIALKCKHDGGRIIINKTTWYAHAHIGALYAGGSEEREKSREYVKILASKL